MSDLYLPLVHGWCLHSGVPRDDLADVVQEVFSAVAQSLDRFRHDQSGGTFRGWLHGIARHKILDYWRRIPTEGRARGGTGAQRQLAECSEWDEDSDTDFVSDTGLLVRRALDRISSNFERTTWQAFWKTSVDDELPSDVAEDLNLTVDAVYQAKSRVMRRLRRELGDL